MLKRIFCTWAVCIKSCDSWYLVCMHVWVVCAVHHVLVNIKNTKRLSGWLHWSLSFQWVHSHFISNSQAYLNALYFWLLISFMMLIEVVCHHQDQSNVCKQIPAEFKVVNPHTSAIRSKIYEAYHRSKILYGHIMQNFFLKKTTREWSRTL